MTVDASVETPVFTISTAASLLGISIHTLRMYERKGLILPHKNHGNQRRYSERDIERLKCIRKAIRLEKISIEGIRRVLALAPCWAVAHCSSEVRSTCKAYNGHTQPCWTLRSGNAQCDQEECRQCDVYRNLENCQSIKDRIRELLPT
jgi:MerR family transcriptional regulator/heat shock protein HspR